MAKILLADDNPVTLRVLSTILETDGFEVTASLGGEKAKECLAADKYDLLLSDIRMAPVNGMDLLRQVHKEKPGMPVIMLTAYGSVETAVEALKLGAYDYITKPFRVDELRMTVRRALKQSKTDMEDTDLEEHLEDRYQLQNLVAESEAMRNVCAMIRKVAPTKATILVQGDNGVGKGMVAKAIHANSLRRTKRFLAVNCATLPEPLLDSELFGCAKGSAADSLAKKQGLLRAAAAGTVYFDEIDMMPPAIQDKLLHIFQTGHIRSIESGRDIPVDVRIIASTNADLEKRVADRAFREDLFRLISIISIHVPPLREREEDILPLARMFLRTAISPSQTPLKLDREVADILETYPWPGNARELKNAMTHAVSHAANDRITRDSLPSKLVVNQFSERARNKNENDGKASFLKTYLRSMEKEYTEQVRSITQGDNFKKL